MAGFTPGTPIAIVIFDEQSEEIGRARGPQLFGKGPFAEIQIDAFDIDSQPLPETYLLATPYPNPFNATTSITIALPETAEISVKVYDILGSEVAVLYRGNLEAGRHQLQWSGNSDAGSSVSSGVYFVRMQTPVGVQTEKIVVMK